MGFVPAGGTLVRLVRQIGYAPAMEILLTGDRFDAEHMRRIGVVNRVVPPQDLAAAARELCRTRRRTKQSSVLTLGDLPLDEAFAREANSVSAPSRAMTPERACAPSPNVAPSTPSSART